MPDERQKGLLRDILDSASTAAEYVRGVSCESFMANSEKQDAVLRRLEIIGEAASRLSPETQAHFPQVPFRMMRGMRNIIAHDYGDVNLDRVWHTVTTDLVPLIETLENYFVSVK